MVDVVYPPRRIVSADVVGALGYTPQNAADVVIAAPGGATLTAGNTRTTYTNEGAPGLAVFNLPTAVAGLRFGFVVENANGIEVVASSGDTIAVSPITSALAGNATSTTLNSRLELICLNATEWSGLASGQWSIT